MSSVEVGSIFNCSVVSLTCNLGWGIDPSVLRITVVEDESSFTPANIGDPVFFSYGSLNFGGLLQDYREKLGPDGNLFDITLIDPRTILEGVQLIIDRYTGGVFGVPNLFNIFGALESTGFGNSQVNEVGIPWQLVRDTFVTLHQTSPVLFSNNSYYVDLSNLPNLPSYYRISAGSSIDLMSYIADICDAANHDFFFKLVRASFGPIVLGNVIKLYTVNRSTQPVYGKIASFLSNQQEVARSEVGFELRNETASRFLVGGNVCQIYFNTPQSGEPEDFADNTILPYWGLNEEGDIIVGSGHFDDDHNFRLPSRGVNVLGVGSEYHINVEEMRSALVDQESWEVLLESFNNLEESIHFGKAIKTGLISDARFARDVWESKTVPELEGLTPIELSNFLGVNFKKAGDSITSRHEENISRYYGYVRSYAEEFYGRKFMVRIPFVSARLTEHDEIQTTLEPAEGGFIEDIYFSGAASLNLMPINTNFVTLPDGRVECYARFDRLERLDLSELGKDDYIISNNSVFVKASLEPNIQFLDRQTAFSPRAILQLPGRVKLATVDDSKSHLGLLRQIMNRVFPRTIHSGIPTADRLQIFHNIGRKLGSELTFLGYEGMALIPDLVAIPLRSNVDFYGPWYAVGANGKTEFEQDPDLVPWNFGGYALMDLTGASRVSDALTNLQVGEGGSIELPGIPIVDLGAELILNGPYLTNINVSIGSNGLTTTYEMSTWTPKFGKVTKQYLDQLKKNRLKEQKYARLFKSLTTLPLPDSDKYKQREFQQFLRPSRRGPHTSSTIVAGEVIHMSGDYRKANMILSPSHNIINHIPESGYNYKSVNSIDVLFRPFTTEPTASGWPHYELPSGNNISDIDNLDPFENSDFLVYNRDYPADDESLKDADGYIRGVGLRGPVMIVGWGLDTDCNPVPNNGSDQFITEHKKKMDQWKVGPLDVRWDNFRKVWAGGNFIKRGILQGTISVSGSALALNEDTRSLDIVYDWLLTGSQSMTSGTHIFYVSIGCTNWLFAGSCA